jgi:uncharacterized membrane protein
MWLWALLAIYAVARVTQAFPGRIPVVAIVALHVLPSLAFAMVYGAMVYRVRGILVFVFLCLVIGNIFESLGVHTGFPFGHYHFTSVMGPMLFQVPIVPFWTLAGVILGGSRVLAQPLLAAFIMVASDLSMDPVRSNLVYAWIWQDGGAWFGVPVTNFLGWYLTVYLIYQAFALWIRTGPLPNGPGSVNLWRVAVLFFGVCAAGNLFVIGPLGVSVIMDASGAT